MSPHDPTSLPSNLPVPQDDGAASHLLGLPLPNIALASTANRIINLQALKNKAVFFFYPRSGVPGRPPPDGWGLVPGARGCTPHSCAYRDLASSSLLSAFPSTASARKPPSTSESLRSARISHSNSSATPTSLSQMR